MAPAPPIHQATMDTIEQQCQDGSSFISSGDLGQNNSTVVSLAECRVETVPTEVQIKEKKPAMQEELAASSSYRVEAGSSDIGRRVNFAAKDEIANFLQEDCHASSVATEAEVTRGDCDKPESELFTLPPSSPLDRAMASIHDDIIKSSKGFDFRLKLEARHIARLEKRGLSNRLDPLNSGSDQYECIAKIAEGYIIASESRRVVPEKVAVKIITAFSFLDVYSHELQCTQLLAELEHPNVASMIDHTYLRTGFPEATKEEMSPENPHSDLALCIIFPLYLYQGEKVDLSMFVTRYPQQALPLFQQVVAGVRAMHTVGVAHRDIKEANIMIQGNSIEDAIAVHIDFGSITGEESSTLFCGTKTHMAAEVLRGKLYSPKAIDYYSLAVIALNLIRIVGVPSEQVVELRRLSRSLHREYKSLQKALELKQHGMPGLTFQYAQVADRELAKPYTHSLVEPSTYFLSGIFPPSPI